MTSVVFDPLAERELIEAAEFYEGKVQGLGDAFLLEARRALDQLSTAPLSCPRVRGELRRRPLFRFPYSLLYRVAPHSVQIIAVVHQHRGPRFLAKRLRGV